MKLYNWSDGSLRGVPEGTPGYSPYTDTSNGQEDAAPDPCIEPLRLAITDLERAGEDAEWMTRDGRILVIRDMDDSHVFNCGFMLLKNGAWVNNPDMMAEFIFRWPRFAEKMGGAGFLR